MNEEQHTCHWQLTDPDFDSNTFETECGKMWTFVDGGVEDNGLKYCPYCGGKVDE